jgi:alkylation response protein AidB-like acyl-CoA dehydrogenase
MDLGYDLLPGNGVSQTPGGYGYFEKARLAKVYRGARVCQSCEGNGDIQRRLIARSL